MMRLAVLVGSTRVVEEALDPVERRVNVSHETAVDLDR